VPRFSSRTVRLRATSDMSKNLAGPSESEQGTGIASKGVALESMALQTLV